MLPTGPKFAVDLLVRLGVWAPWIWSGSAAAGGVLLAKLYRDVRKGRRDQAIRNLETDGEFLRLLIFFERLLAASFAFLGLLIAVGVASKLAPHNALVGLGTLMILLAVPPFITWVAFRAIRIRVSEA